MKTKYLPLIALVILLSLVSACAPLTAQAQAPATNPTPRTLTAQGEGKVYLAPDLAYVFIGVHSESESVGNSLNANSQQATAVADALKALGVDAKDIQTSAFNVYPQQQYDNTGKPTKIVYMVDNTVNVTVRDLQKLSQILDTSVKTGANSISGIQFDIKDKAAAVAEARKLAIDDAKQQAQDLAAAGGVQLGDLQTLNVFNNTSPLPVYEGKGGGGAALSVASSVPVSSGQLVIVMDATLIYEMK